MATTDSVVQTSAPPHSLTFDRTPRDLPLLLSLCYAQPVTAPSFFFFLGFRFFTFPSPPSYNLHPPSHPPSPPHLLLVRSPTMTQYSTAHYPQVRTCPNC